jgi:hypothetical protein
LLALFVQLLLQLLLLLHDEQLQLLEQLQSVLC